MHKTHTYRGREIKPCTSVKESHKGQWYIQSYHYRTGIPYSDGHCPHVQTLAEAREAIDQQLAVEAQA